MDAALGFWLQYVESEGGLHEGGADRVQVVLPPTVQRVCGLPEELTVTGDPDVAREEGATLLSPGHPVLASTADQLLVGGDVGVLVIPRSAGVPPSAEVLLAKARDQFPVDHGKIDLAGGVCPARRYVVRVGVLVEYSVSAESRFQERAECWVDATARLELAQPMRASLARRAGQAVATADASLGDHAEIRAGLAEAHTLITARATRRLDELAADAARDHAGERDRARAYYDSALASIARRRATAPPDRAALLDARADSTRQERDRRLAEIAEKYQPRHQTHPFRLHVLVVPAMRLPVHVRRGERRYPLNLDWLIPAGAFAGLRCPHCGEFAGLVAAKSRLGCRSCLAPAPVPVLAHAPRAHVPVPAPAARVPAPVHAANPAPRRGGPHGASADRAGGVQPPATDARAEVSRPQPSAAPRPSAAPGAPAARQPSEAEISAAGQRLAISFWHAAGAQSKKLRGTCSANSPVATAVTLFGGDGPFRAIGVPPADPPVSVSVALSDGRHGRNVTTGVIETDSARYIYQLTWHFNGRVPVVDEVTPFGHQFGGRGPASTQFRYGPELFSESTPTRARLDGVARHIWRVALPSRGLPLVLRCITAWWRVAGGPGDPVPLSAAELGVYPPTVLAAALDRLVGYRATGFGVYAEVAAAYRVAEADMRKATLALQRHLQLSADRLY